MICLSSRVKLDVYLMQRVIYRPAVDTYGTGFDFPPSDSTTATEMYMIRQ